MAKQPSDVTNHHDVSKAAPAPGKDTNPAHAHPSESIPVRAAKESSFVGPGLDVPVGTQRPVRDAGTPQDHPLNRPIDTDDESLIGPQLGRGGVAGPSVPPVDATCVYVDPDFTGKSGETFEVSPSVWTPEWDKAAADAHFVDRSDLLLRPRKGTTTSD